MAKPKTPNKTPKTRVVEDDDELETPEETPNDDDEPEGLDEKKINAIVTNRVKRALKPFEKLLSDLGGKIDALGKKPEASEEDLEDDEPEETEEKPAEGKKPEVTGARPADVKWRKKMEKDLREEREKREAAERAQKDAAEKAKKDEERATVMKALEKAGISDPKAQRAAYLSMVEDGLVTRDDEGKVCIKSVDKYGDEELIAPGQGASAWVKSDGKSFLPAVEAGGSGGGAATNTGEGARRMSKQEFSKLDKKEQAKIELWRASNGLPPLDAQGN